LRENEDQRFQNHADVTAVFTTVLGFLFHVWTAYFLNPDEALHFRLANQVSYRTNLTASHPPLLTLLLYFRRARYFRTLLRLPWVLAGEMLAIAP
jgi:hypothetical protein